MTITLNLSKEEVKNMLHDTLVAHNIVPPDYHITIYQVSYTENVVITFEQSQNEDTAKLVEET